MIIIIYLLNQYNKCIFRIDLNVSRDDTFLISTGNLFHKVSRHWSINKYSLTFGTWGGIRVGGGILVDSLEVVD